MRILFITPYYKPAVVYGGPTKSIATLCEAITRQGTEVSVYTTDLNGSERLESTPLHHPVEVDGVLVHYFPISQAFLYYSHGITKALRETVSDFDLVVYEILWSPIFILGAHECQRRNVPYISTVRNQLFPWALEKSSFRKHLFLRLGGWKGLNEASAIRCTTHLEVDAVRALKLKPPTFILPNGIELDTVRESPGQSNITGKMQIPEDALVMIFLGRLTRTKRPDLAIDALRAVQVLDYMVHLVFVGPDENGMMAELSQQAKKYSLSDKVHFTGLLTHTEVNNALKDADLMLLPSEVQENFSMSTVEAMAAGVPVLVSTGVPVGRWAEAAGAGQVVPCTAEAFSQATIEMLADREALKAMGARGKILVKEKFDIDVIARQMLAQYQAIIDTGKPLPEVAS